MRNALDFTPFYRSSIGFDRVFNLLENATPPQSVDSWPPYDIARTDENNYRLTVALPGFSGRDVEISYEPNLLIITGERKDENDAEYLHRGMVSKSFIRRFELADHMKVASATLDNGLLSIQLVREVPEAMKPRRIEIESAQTASKAEKLGPKQAA